MQYIPGKAPTAAELMEAQAARAAARTVRAINAPVVIEDSRGRRDGYTSLREAAGFIASSPTKGLAKREPDITRVEEAMRHAPLGVPQQIEAATCFQQGAAEGHSVGVICFTRWR